MIGTWPILSLVLVGILILVAVILVGVIGTYATEDVTLNQAIKQGILLAFGRGEDPKHTIFSAMYFPVAMLAMLFITGALLTELWARTKSGQWQGLRARIQ